MNDNCKIIVKHGDKLKIAKVFNVTSGMVGAALNGRRNSDLAKKIRYVATSQYDGKMMQPVEPTVK